MLAPPRGRPRLGLPFTGILASLCLVPCRAFAEVPAGRSPEADRQYRFAMLLASREDLDRAEVEFRRFVDRFPSDPRRAEIEFWLGYTLQKASRSAEAAEILGKWITGNPRHKLADRALFWRGKALDATGRTREARAAWREVTRAYPESPRAANALDALGWSHFRAGEWEKALSAYRDLRRRFPDQKVLAEGARRLVGECLLKLGRPEEALAEFDALLALAPPSGGAPSAAARVEALDQNRPPASPAPGLPSAGTLGGSGGSERSRTVMVEALHGRANALLAMGRAEEASREFGRAIELAERTRGSEAVVPEAMLSHASALLSAGHAEEALGVLGRLELRGDRGRAGSRAIYWRGLALEALGRRGEAAKAYEEALADPRTSAVHARAAWQLAELRYRGKDALGAVAAYDRVVALGDPPAGGEPRGLVERALYNSAVTLGEAGRVEDALSRVERLLRDFREGALAADALYAAGEFLARLGRTREAASRYGDFLARFPRDRRARDARYRRARCLNAAGSFEAAKAELGLFLGQYPKGKEAAEAAFLLGEIARRSGDLEEAERAYRKALRAGGTPEREAEALWSLSSLAAEARRGDEARALAERLVREHPDSRLAPWASLLVADSDLSSGRAEEALAGYRAFMGKSTARELVPRARAGVAWALMELGRKGEALDAFRELAREHPDTRYGAEAFYRAAALLRESAAHSEFGELGRAVRPGEEPGLPAAGRTEGPPAADGPLAEAAALLDELLRRHPESRFTEAAALERALVQRDRGEVDAAIRELARFEKRFPGSALVPEALRALALAHFSKGNRGAERSAWRRIAGRFPESHAAFDAYLGLAEIAEEEGDLEAAALNYARAAAGSTSPTGAPRPEASAAAFRRADCLERLGRRKEARAAFADVAEAFPKSREATGALLRAGKLAMQAGELKEAEALLARAESVSPGSATVELARAVRLSGRPAEAVKLVSGYVRKQGIPAGAARRARLELALSLSGLGRHAEAEPVLRGVIRGGEDELSAGAQHALATSLVARGKHREAERAFYELLLLYPLKTWQAEARFRLGETNERLGEFARAREFYAELLRENPESPHAKRARERIEALTPGRGGVSDLGPEATQ